MTHTFDEQLKRAFESLTERVQTNLAELVNSTVEQLSDVVTSERKAAADEAAAAAEAATTARLQESFAATEEHIKETARGEWFEAGLQQAREEAASAMESREAEVRQLLEVRDIEYRAALAAKEADFKQLLDSRERDFGQLLGAREGEFRTTLELRLAEARNAFEAREAEVTGRLEAQIAELRTTLESRESELRTLQTTETELRELMETRDAETRKAQEARENEVRQLLESREARARAAVDAANQAAQLAASQAAAHAAMLRAEAVSKAESRAFEVVLEAMQSVDGATSLTQALEGLVAVARPQADRVALFMVRGETLRAWIHAGFADFGGQAEFPLAQSGIVADAVRSGLPQRVVGNDGRRPSFANESSGAFVAVPLLLNGHVTGVLCGEQLSPPDEGKRLSAMYEIIARHATRVLESLTALRLAHVNAQVAVAAPKH